MFRFYVLSFFKIGDTIQGGTLFKGEHYLRKCGNPSSVVYVPELIGALSDSILHQSHAYVMNSSKLSFKPVKHFKMAI